MSKNRIILSGLIINSLAACSSSPMEMSQPKGEWVDYETPVQTPVRATVKNISTGNNQTSRPAISSGTTPKTTATQERNIIVSRSGKNEPLYNGVRAIVPLGWFIRLSPEVSGRYKGQISWQGNDRWPDVLNKALRNAGLVAVIDDSKRTVTVDYAKATPALAKMATVTKPAEIKTPTVPVSTAPFNKPPAQKPLFSGTAPAVIMQPVRPPAPVLPPLKSWDIPAGVSLKQGYATWAAQETCQNLNGKWTVRWDTDAEYRIDYPLHFKATDFESATTQLFELYKYARVPLKVDGYVKQCLIVISERKN